MHQSKRLILFQGVVLGIFSLILAFMLEWGMGIALTLGNIPVHITLLVLLFWLLGLDIVPGLWLAGGTGVILDTLSLEPFGLYATVCFILVGASAMLRFIFSHTQSVISQLVSIAVGAVICTLLFSLISAIVYMGAR
ncbi:MAG: hypothetical protein HY006_01435 [Candidatus Sungbacteria bacterium]|nr:hypothetical protein [Candidatus Sungbacteria bacterium]